MPAKIRARFALLLLCGAMFGAAPQLWCQTPELGGADSSEPAGATGQIQDAGQSNTRALPEGSEAQGTTNRGQQAPEGAKDRADDASGWNTEQISQILADVLAEVDSYLNGADSQDDGTSQNGAGSQGAGTSQNGADSQDDGISQNGGGSRGAGTSLDGAVSQERASSFRRLHLMVQDLGPQGSLLQVEPIVQPGEFHSFDQNLMYTFQSELPADEDPLNQDRILLIFPLPGPEPKGTPLDLEDSYGYRRLHLAAALTILRILEENHPATALDILFVGGEYEDQKGLQVFLSKPASRDYKAAFWIGGFGDQRSWALTNGSEGLTSPGWMVRAALDRFRAWDVPLRVSNVRTQLYRMGLQSESAIHRLLQAEIPTIMLGSSHFSDASQSYLAGSLPADEEDLTGAADNSANSASGAAFVSAGGGTSAVGATPEALSGAAFGAAAVASGGTASTASHSAAGVASGAASPPSIRDLALRIQALLGLVQDAAARPSGNSAAGWERHYILIQFGQFTWFLGEFPYLVTIFVAIAVSLLWIRLSRHRRRRYTRLLGKFWLGILGLFVASFLVLLLGGFLSELLLRVRQAPTLWEGVPILFFALKLTGGLALASWLYRVIEGLVPSSDGSVFTAGAVFSLLVDVVLLAVLNVSLVYYYLWSLIFTLLFAMTRERWLKLFWFLLSPFWLLKSVIELFSTDSLSVLGPLVRVNPATDLLLAFLVLPYLSMLLRLDILFRKPELPKPRLRLGVRAILLLVATLTLFVGLAFYHPYRSNPQPLDISLRESGSSADLVVSSPANLPEAQIAISGTPLNVDSTTNNQAFSLPRRDDGPQWQTARSGFLNRTIFDGEITFPANTISSEISLYIQGAPIIYDANLPFVIDQVENRIRVFLGDFPDRRIPFRLVLPREADPQMEIEVRTAIPATEIRYEGPAVRIRALQTISSRAPL